MKLKKIHFILFLKPYYNWTTFNTACENMIEKYSKSFKPCYKWNTFNT